MRLDERQIQHSAGRDAFKVRRDRAYEPVNLVALSDPFPKQPCHVDVTAPARRAPRF